MNALQGDRCSTDTEGVRRRVPYLQRGQESPHLYHRSKVSFASVKLTLQSLLRPSAVFPYAMLKLRILAAMQAIEFSVEYVHRPPLRRPSHSTDLYTHEKIHTRTHNRLAYCIPLRRSLAKTDFRRGTGAAPRLSSHSRSTSPRLQASAT